MEHRHIAGETPGAGAYKTNAVAVARIHVGLDLEDETGESMALGRNRTFVAQSCSRLRTQIEEGVQESFDSEISQSAAEEDRRDLAAQELLAVKRLAGAVEQFDFVLQV